MNDVSTRVIDGDARIELPLLVGDRDRTVIITDPVWPRPLASLVGSEDPEGLFKASTSRWNEIAYRAIVILGVDQDPSMLRHVPMPFLRVVWLRYACPSHRGRMLVGAAVAYVYGEPRAAGPKQRVWPGEICATRARAYDPWQSAHPCPLRYQHAEGLVRSYTCARDRVIDPFAGSGVIPDAAARNGRDAVAIEIDPQWVSEIRARLLEATAQTCLPLESA